MSGIYSIPISGLKAGLHVFNFEINKEFFDQFEESEVKEGDLKATVEAGKRGSHIDILTRISGEVTITCDRCLGIFSHPMDCGNRLLVKFGKSADESDPDIITLPPDESELDMKQYFYEYILLALPIQKVHPPDKNGNSTCDPEMIKKLNEHLSSNDQGTDPRWNELKKLINKN